MIIIVSGGKFLSLGVEKLDFKENIFETTIF
jgi:hypothetical protein